MDFRASLRSDAKPQREERWRTDFHCSYERPCSSKSLVDAHFFNKLNSEARGFATHSG